MLLVDGLSKKNRKLAEEWTEVHYGKATRGRWFISAKIPDKSGHPVHTVFLGIGLEWKKRTGVKEDGPVTNVTGPLLLEVLACISVLGATPSGAFIGYDF